MRKKLLLGIFLLLVCYSSIVILTPYSDTYLDRSINSQINHISFQLASGGDLNLQNQYPEGFVFANAIFALSLIEYNDYRYVPLIDGCITKLISEQAQSSFDSSLPLKFGAFYNGWVNYVLSSYIKSDLIKYSSLVKETMVENSQLSLRSRTLSDSLGIFESYDGEIWPADNLAHAASLDSANRFTKKNQLLSLTYEHSDSTGLIYHYIEEQPTVRGSSQALITYFLSQINKDKAIDYNSKYLSQFQSNILGIDLIKENRDGKDYSDIDSGPVIFGIGSVATIMNVKAQSSLGHDARLTWSALNFAGVPINLFGQKKYLFGKELMFDIFMLWTSVSLKDEDKSLN